MHTREPTTSLDSPTKLDRARVPDRGEGRWVLTLYPGAREAGGCFVSAGRREDAGLLREPGPDRSADEAARRARGQIRRYCAANWLNKLGTLTYGPPFCRDPLAVRADVGGFFHRLRKETGALPYLWVPELHADGERYHVHFAVGRYVHYLLIRRVWRHGLIHIEELKYLPVGSGALGEARLAARYLAKYIGKDLDSAAGGLHRYEVAQGFQPRAERIEGPTQEAVLAEAGRRMGVAPEYVWDSAQECDWSSPHAVWASWPG